MQMKSLSYFLTYIDIYGTKYTFFSNKRPKLYTVTGGILSIISIFFCILIPLIFTIDDLNRKIPQITISPIFSESFRKVKIKDEKIRIPWRLIDSNYNEYVNHTGLLYPIIYYVVRTKNQDNGKMNFRKRELKYKLCSETSMENENNYLYKIKIPLNKLYCIDMDELDIGGNLMSELLYYIQFNLFYCEDGINYDQNNPKCTSYNKIIDTVGLNNSLRIAIYYPEVQFQPINKESPLVVSFKQHSFDISRYTSKIEKIFLQKNILTDDSGWVMKKELNTSFWGINLISGDNFYRGEGVDYINQEANSKAYSFSIYLESDIIHYRRFYKKFNSILAETVPVAYIIFFIFKHISKMFKFAEGNKKIIELLFENLIEKPEIMKKNNINSDNNNFMSISFKKVISKDDSNLKNKKKPKISVDNVLSRKNNNFHRSSVVNKKRNTNLTINNFNLKASNKIFVQNKKMSYNNMSNQNLLFESGKKREFIINDEKVVKIPQKKKSDKNVIQSQQSLVKKKLFPYKYYLFSVFIKNLNISKGNYLFSSRFAKVYTFLCQLFDVTTYISLQREFSLLKNTLSEKNIKLIENYNKINVNSKNFLKDISYCIGEQKLNILAQGVKK